jgi:hypothetical protein
MDSYLKVFCCAKAFYDGLKNSKAMPFAVSSTQSPDVLSSIIQLICRPLY